MLIFSFVLSSSIVGLYVVYFQKKEKKKVTFEEGIKSVKANQKQSKKTQIKESLQEEEGKPEEGKTEGKGE